MVVSQQKQGVHKKMVAVTSKVIKHKAGVSVNKVTGFTDLQGHKLAFAPNFVHSFDASLCHSILLGMTYSGLSVYTIHDCFATTPGNLLTMREIAKACFTEIEVDKEGGHYCLTTGGSTLPKGGEGAQLEPS